MSDIPLSKLGYVEGMAEAYAETVAKVGKPFASFEIVFDDEKDNWDTVKLLEESVKEIANEYNIKYHVRKSFSEFKDARGKIFKKPRLEFNYYKSRRILKEYLSIISKKSLSTKDHKRLGEIFGYTKNAINSFLRS
jgi:hypothetical protein